LCLAAIVLSVSRRSRRVEGRIQKEEKDIGMTGTVRVGGGGFKNARESRQQDQQEGAERLRSRKVVGERRDE